LRRALRRIEERARPAHSPESEAGASAAVAHDLRNQLALAALECGRIAAQATARQQDLRGVETALRAARELCAVLLGSGIAQASPHGARVEVEASALPNGELELTVRDGGAGMNVEQLARSMRAGASGHGGAGYGSASVLACVERMDAVLEIESEPGRGTRARLLVPGACIARRAALAFVDPDPHATPSEEPRSSAPEHDALSVRDVGALERALARRAVERVVARRTLPARERARLEASAVAALRAVVGERAPPGR
jgi:hypothetical protein